MLTKKYYSFFKTWHEELRELKIEQPEYMFLYERTEAERILRELGQLLKDYREIKQEDSSLAGKLIAIGNLGDRALIKKAREIKYYWKENKSWLKKKRKIG